jgi:hypothetical protein
MRKSHFVFIGICVVFVIFQISVTYSEALQTQEDKAGIMGAITGSLIYPGIGYGLYLIFRKITSKNKTKTPIKNSN